MTVYVITNGNPNERLGRNGTVDEEQPQTAKTCVSNGFEQV